MPSFTFFSSLQIVYKCVKLSLIVSISTFTILLEFQYIILKLLALAQEITSELSKNCLNTSKAIMHAQMFPVQKEETMSNTTELDTTQRLESALQRLIIT